MNQSERLSILKVMMGVEGNTLDGEMLIFLDFAKRELIAWRYGYGTNHPIARASNSNSNPTKVSLVSFITETTPAQGEVFVFTYTNSKWVYESAEVELEDYGISVLNDPIEGEIITIKYSENALAEFDTVMILSVIAGYGLKGIENQTSSTENGITRQFKYTDMVQYIRGNVPSHIGVM